MKDKLQQKINLKTKPIGALGLLEDLALKIGNIQQSLYPSLKKPALVVFSGDHGIANEGVSAYPQEVTHQMVLNFINNGAAINIFTKQHNIDIHIVDAGVNFNFINNEKIIDHKIGYGTKNFLNNKAMNLDEFDECVYKGKTIVKDIALKGANIIGFGEMGIGNTSSSSIIMSYICNFPIKDCVGKGTGIDNTDFLKKINILEKSKIYHGDLNDVKEIFYSFGGFEMVQMYGAMLEAYKQNMIILVDGFIASTVFLVASKINPNIIDNAIFCHLSDEKAHSLLLKYLNVDPILKLNLRLGEGTGCALAYPIIQSSVNFLNDMASFDSAGVSEKT
tara:strand:- start:3391 stop:4392 length:1002 start_codon:yes stop_codon:yes gene_type:complete